MHLTVCVSYINNVHFCVYIGISVDYSINPKLRKMQRSKYRKSKINRKNKVIG